MTKQDSKTIGNSIEETRKYHTRYLRAISSPLRREILRALKGAYSTIEGLQSHIGLDKDALRWHLSVLVHGFCIEMDIKQGKRFYKLTQEGRVVDYLE